MGPPLRNRVRAMISGQPEVWQRPAGTGGPAGEPGTPNRSTAFTHGEGLAIMAGQVDEKPGLLPSGSARDVVIWPDPSPLDSWWAAVVFPRRDVD